MASALKVLSVVETEATGPAADMKERIYNSGLNNAQEPTTSTSNAYEDNTHSHVPESMPAKATNTTQMPQNGKSCPKQALFCIRYCFRHRCLLCQEVVSK